MINRIFDLRKIWKCRFVRLEDRSERNATKPMVIWTEVHAIDPNSTSDEVFCVLDYPQIVKMDREVMKTQGWTNCAWADNGCHYHERPDWFVTDQCRTEMRKNPEQELDEVTKIYVKPCSTKYGGEKILAYV